MLIQTILIAALALLVPACSAACAPSLAPVGSGLTAMAISMVACSVVRSLTKLVTGKKSKAPAVSSAGYHPEANPQPEEHQQP